MHFIDLICDPEKQTEFYIVPQCCIHAAHHLVKVLDHASSVAGFHYELNSGKGSSRTSKSLLEIRYMAYIFLDIFFPMISSFFSTGSLLGAVKLSNFIPWDIDGDVYIPTEHMYHFHKNGIARFLLESEGMKVYR